MSIGSALSGFRLREFSDNVKSFFLYGVLINAGMALFSLLFNLYLLRLSFQEDFPDKMFVYPVNSQAQTPSFFEFAEVPTLPADIDPATIDEKREQWLDAWTRVVLR